MITFPSNPEYFAHEVFGTVEKLIAGQDKGRVQAFGTTWPAKLIDSDQHSQVFAGQLVKVVARQNITLLIALID